MVRGIRSNRGSCGLRHTLGSAGVVVLLASVTGAQEPEASPTVDQLVARHVAAKGGAEALAGLRALKATGTHLIFSEPAPFTLWRARPDRVRLDTVMLGMPVVESYDGETGWASQPPAGADWSLPMTPAELTAAQAIADFDTPLIGWAEKGHAVTLEGREDFDGVDAWRLEVERAEGFTETWFLDAESHLEAGKLGPAHDFGHPAEARTWFDDFRPVAGVMIPHVVESEYFIRHRKLVIEAVEANPELPADLFAMPPLAAMAKLAPMAGEWNVAVEFKPFPRAPWQEQGATTATVVPIHGGAALQEEIETSVAGRTTRALVTWSWDRFAERYRVTVLDDYTSHLNVFEGTPGEDGQLAVTNAATGTRRVSEGEPVTERIVLSVPAADGFTVEYQSTPDGGETWVGSVRLSYARPAGDGGESAAAAQPAAP